jgi:7-cyano-7-deazaguanine reductase
MTKEDKLMKNSLKSKKSSLKKQTEPKKSSPGRDSAELKGFSLGETETHYPQTYSPKVLEAFDNKNPGKIAWTSFICTEFTSLCPKTGQPDYAKIYVNYIADKKMVESKSLKLYLFSFRNHGDFHEDCVQKICDDLAQLMNPLYLEVIGEFTPRGGIAIFPYAQYAIKQSTFQELKNQRLFNYSPGKYSMELSKLY